MPFQKFRILGSNPRDAYQSNLCGALGFASEDTRRVFLKQLIQKSTMKTLTWENFHFLSYVESLIALVTYTVLEFSPKTLLNRFEEEPSKS